jgi:hypothetical protein
MSEADSPLVPEWEALGVSVSDEVEPEDADVDEHTVHAEEDN